MIMRSILVLGLLLLSGLHSPVFAQKTNGWHNELAPGLAEAKRTGKPIFLVFRCEP